MPPGGVPRASCRSRRRSCFRDRPDEVRRILQNRNKTGRIHRPISDNTYIPRALLLKLVSKNNRGKQGLFLAIRSLRAQEIGSRRSSSRHVAYKAECRDVQRQGDRAGLPVFGTIPATGASRVRVIPSRGRKSRRFRCCRAGLRESSGANRKPSPVSQRDILQAVDEFRLPTAPPWNDSDGLWRGFGECCGISELAGIILRTTRSTDFSGGLK